MGMRKTKGICMQYFKYNKAPYPIRNDIRAAYQAYWQKLAAPGNWWTGAERIAIARESRNALACEICTKRKDALSPHNFPGEHDHDGGLPDRAIDAVHRIITDQIRITQTYVDENAASGLSKEAYVELVGIVVAVFSIDEFNRALDIDVEELPEPIAGKPSGYRPAMLCDDIGFVPTIPTNGAVGNEADLWPSNRSANVVRALSLVPDALRDWRQISIVQYLPHGNTQNYEQMDERVLNRTQIELIAGRVSAVNECFY
jgi:hypothetical protein